MKAEDGFQRDYIWFLAVNDMTTIANFATVQILGDRKR